MRTGRVFEAAVCKQRRTSQVLDVMVPKRVDSPVRVVIQQPCLPLYRIPVFRQLSATSGVAVKVEYGVMDEIANAEPDQFAAQYCHVKRWKLGRAVFCWHSAQWANAAPHKADVLVLGWEMKYLSLLPALLKAKLSNVPTILWGHGSRETDSIVVTMLRRLAANLSTAVMFYNQAAAAQYIQTGLPKEKVFVALNSLYQTPIAEAREYWLQHKDELSQFQRSRGLDGRRVLLFVSRLHPGRRVDLLLQALVNLRSEFPTALTVVIGDGDYRQVLEASARDLGVAENVLFLSGIYDERELGAWFMSAEVFVFPSCIGLSLLHAFGYGLPVVTSDRLSRQNPEIEALKTGENGFLYKDEDATALAECIAHLLRDSQLRNRMSNNALLTVQEEYTIEHMCEGMLSAMEYCVAKSSGKA